MTDDRRSHAERDPEARIRRLSPEAIGLPAAPLTDPHDVQEVLEHLGKIANLLGPVMALTEIPPDYALVFRVVAFDPEIRGGESSNGVWYKQQRGLALHKPALRQLVAAAGIADVPEQSGRLDDGRVPYIATVRVVISVPRLDGSRLPVGATKTVDLRDGSPEYRNITKGAKNEEEAAKLAGEARRFIERLAESKAKNAAIRDALAIRQVYTYDEARRPFVFPHLVYVPPDTAEVRAIRTLHALNAPASVYGAAMKGIFGRETLGETREAEGSDVIDAEKLAAGKTPDRAAPGGPDAAPRPRVIEQKEDLARPVEREREREPVRREGRRDDRRDDRRPAALPPEREAPRRDDRRVSDPDDDLPAWMRDGPPPRDDYDFPDEEPPARSRPTGGGRGSGGGRR